MKVTRVSPAPVKKKPSLIPSDVLVSTPATAKRRATISNVIPKGMPCVYVLHITDKVYYVGYTRQFQRRLDAHALYSQLRVQGGRLYASVMGQVTSFKMIGIPCVDVETCERLERDLIKQLQASGNIVLNTQHAT